MADQATILNTIAAALNQAGSLAQSHPTFEGKGALRFVSKFEKYAVVHGWTDVDMVQKFANHCCAAVASRVHDHCVQEGEDGDDELVRWASLRTWFLSMYGRHESVEEIHAQAVQSMSAADSHMRTDESMSAYLDRFTLLVDDINGARVMVNKTIPVPEEAKSGQGRAERNRRRQEAYRDSLLRMVSDREQASWLKERLNETFYEDCNLKFKNSGSYGDICSYLIGGCCWACSQEIWSTKAH